MMQRRVLRSLSAGAVASLSISSLTCVPGTRYVIGLPTLVECQYDMPFMLPMTTCPKSNSDKT